MFLNKCCLPDIHLKSWFLSKKYFAKKLPDYFICIIDLISKRSNDYPQFTNEDAKF